MDERVFAVESTATSQQGVQALYLKRGERPALFALHYPPADLPLKGLVVYVHPLAEEMNKSRRMAALQARALAQAHFAVLQLDLSGCGDSAGELADVDWADWVSDVVAACGWLQTNYAAQDSAAGRVPLWLWGLRSGCLVAAQAAEQLGTACHLLFWQAAVNGQLVLTQHLRLATAANMLSKAEGPKLAELKTRLLEQGQSVLVAGYEMGAGLAKGLAAASLQAPTRPCRAIWLELSAAPAAELSPAGARAAASWRDAGIDVHTAVIEGPQFWQTLEIEVAPLLVSGTTEALQARTDAAATCAIPQP